MEELYMGNIGFDSRVYQQNGPFVKAAKRKLDSMEKLNALLDESGKELFDQYCDAQGDIEDITRYDTYTEAVSLGILLMVEVFTATYGAKGARHTAGEQYIGQ